MSEATPGFNAGDQFWPLVITVDRATALKNELQLDIDDTAKFFIRLASKRMLFAAALWCICEKVADIRSVTPEQFAELLDPATMDEAQIGLKKAVELFTPPHQRGAMKALIEAGIAAETSTMKTAAEWATSSEAVDLLDSMTKEAICEATASLSGKQSTD